MTKSRSAPLRHIARGVTLMEILVVLALMGLLIEVAAAALGPVSQAEAVRATNQLVSTMRYAYDRARVYGQFVRMEIDVDKGTFSLQQTDARMYLPATDRDGKVVKIDPDKVKAQMERDKAAAESFNSSLAKTSMMPRKTASGTPGASSTPQAGAAAAKPVAAPGEAGSTEEEIDPYAVEAQQVPRARPPLFESFSAENTLSGLGEPIELPKGMKIVSVRTDADPEEIKTGKAYIYFFPGGRTQVAHVLLQHEDRDDEVTLKLAPLTGKVAILPTLEPLKLPDDVNAGVDDLGRKLERRSF